MTGEDLKKILEDNPSLLMKDIKYTIEYLLKRRLINPSTLIDSQVDILEFEKDKYKSHFIEADTCRYLMEFGNKEQKEMAKIRGEYNSQFNSSFPTNCKLTEEELEKARKFFDLMYGFIPDKD